MSPLTIDGGLSFYIYIYILKLYMSLLLRPKSALKGGELVLLENFDDLENLVR